MVRSQIVKKINQAICGKAKGIFSDDYWEGVEIVQSSLERVTDDMGIECFLNNATYENGEYTVMPLRKRWTYLVGDFKNQIVVTILACGAGTVIDPLSKYDVVSYAS